MVKALLYGVIYRSVVKDACRNLRDFKIPYNTSLLTDGSKEGVYVLFPEAEGGCKASVNNLKVLNKAVVSFNRPSIIYFEDGRVFVRKKFLEDPSFVKNVPDLIEELKINLRDLLSKSF